MIVYTQISIAIILTCISCIFFHYQQGSRLAPPPVAASLLTCV